MAAHENDDIIVAGIKVAALWVMSHVVHNYHEFAGNVLVTLSVGYVAFKIYRDVKKYIQDQKQQKHGNTKQN